MLKIFKTTALVVSIGIATLLLTGCETDQKLDQIIKNLETLNTQKKETAPKGVSCDNERITKILKSIVDKKFNGDFEIEKDNIVIWDYNPVGRYTCKAKIKKVGNRKERAELPKDDTAAILATMNQMFAPANYGISSNGGWVNYYTYITTTSTPENNRFYVEIFTDSQDVE